MRELDCKETPIGSNDYKNIASLGIDVMQHNHATEYLGLNLGLHAALVRESVVSLLEARSLFD